MDNKSSGAINAYATQYKDGLNPRELEASVLIKGALLLKEVQDNWEAPDLFKRLDEALRFNQNLWTLFQSELSEPNHPLPKELRENLLNLSVFLDKRMYDAMAFPAKEKLDAIIAINYNIAQGLRGSAAEPAESGQ